MTLFALLIFAGALLADAISPGPTVAALVARVLSRGARDVLPFLLAIWLGEALWLSLAIAGLAALAASFELMFQAIKWIGVTYLAYLAWTLFTREPAAPSDREAALPIMHSGISAFLSGLSVTIGNPKNMLFYLTLVPSLIDMNSVTTKGWVELVATLIVTLVCIDLFWVFLASRARGFLRNSRAIRSINRISGGAMAIAAAAIAIR